MLPPNMTSWYLSKIAEAEGQSQLFLTLLPRKQIIKPSFLRYPPFTQREETSSSSKTHYEESEQTGLTKLLTIYYH